MGCRAYGGRGRFHRVAAVRGGLCAIKQKKVEILEKKTGWQRSGAGLCAIKEKKVEIVKKNRDGSGAGPVFARVGCRAEGFLARKDQAILVVDLGCSSLSLGLARA